MYQYNVFILHDTLVILLKSAVICVKIHFVELYIK